MEKFEDIKKQINSDTVLILDLDGTLVDLGVDWASLKRELTDYCLENKKEKITFSKLNDDLEFIRRKYGEQFYKELLIIISKFELNEKNYRINMELIEYINKLKNKLIIYSMNTAICVNRFFKKYLKSNPVLIISRETCIESKPTDKDLLQAAKFLKIDKEKFIFIGNSNYDFLSGKYADVKTYIINF